VEKASKTTTKLFCSCDVFLKAVEELRRQKRKFTGHANKEKIEKTVNKNKDKINELFKTIRKDIKLSEQDFDFRVYFGSETLVASPM
jgi:hypothetical protein